jgi:HK97 family phage portal protein
MKLWRDFTNSLTLRADMGGVQLRPDSDLWYQHYGYQTASGLRVSPESAMRVSTVYACVRVIAETIASLPLVIYRTLPDGGKTLASDHPLFRLLHDKPNISQTSYEFWEMMMAHLELRGNAFARIVPGPNGAADQLIPLHPDRVSVFRLPNGKLRYQVRYYYTAEVDYYAQEEMFHLRGMSSDGLVGMSTIAIGAEVIGAGLAAQEFASRFFENDSTPSGVAIHPKGLTQSAHDRIKASWREAHSGMNQHSVAILEEGMTYQNVGMTNKDSQLLEARQFSRGDIASLFRVPPHKIGDLTRATFSNIEQQSIEFATDCIRPRLVRLERRIVNDLMAPLELGDGNEYFCEFLMDALMRGDQKSRYDAYTTAINAGWLTRNEARSMENRNPIDGLDDPLTPLNMVPVNETADTDLSTDVQDPAAPEDDTGTGGARKLALLRGFVQATAERVVRREVRALRQIDKRANGNFTQQVREFYSQHMPFVAEAMRIQDCDASVYVSENCEVVEARRTDGINYIENDSVERLTKLSLQEQAKLLTA